MMLTLPTQSFFIPTPRFLDYICQLKYEFIVDCGAGSGLLVKMLSDRNQYIIGYDIIFRESYFGDVICPVDTTNCSFSNQFNKKLGILARPCRGDWINDTIDNLISQNFDIMYIGVERNFEEDLYNRTWTKVLEYAGNDYEEVYMLVK